MLPQPQKRGRGRPRKNKPVIEEEKIHANTNIRRRSVPVSTEPLPHVFTFIDPPSIEEDESAEQDDADQYEVHWQPGEVREEAQVFYSAQAKITELCAYNYRPAVFKFEEGKTKDAWFYTHFRRDDPPPLEAPFEQILQELIEAENRLETNERAREPRRKKKPKLSRLDERRLQARDLYNDGETSVQVIADTTGLTPERVKTVIRRIQRGQDVLQDARKTRQGKLQQDHKSFIQATLERGRYRVLTAKKIHAELCEHFKINKQTLGVGPVYRAMRRMNFR